MSELEPSDLIQQGDQCFTKGDDKGACNFWQAAADLAHAQKKPYEEAKALHRLAKIWTSSTSEMSQFKIFISGCMDELRNEREAVKLAFKNLKDAGLNIETFDFPNDAGANPYSASEVWEARLSASTAYIGIFYKQYGKYTVMELEKAISLQLPCFIYVSNYHAVAGTTSERAVELQTVFDNLSSVSSVVTMAKFEKAYDLEPLVARDFLRWLIGQGQKAQKALMLSQSDLLAANREIDNKIAAIATLNEELGKLKASAIRERRALERQIRQLKYRKQTRQGKLKGLRETASQLRGIVTEREEQIIKAQQAIIAEKPLWKSLTKEQIAERIKHTLEERLLVQVDLVTTTSYIDLKAQIKISYGEISPQSHTLLLRVMDAPFVLQQIQAMREQVKSLLATSGLLLVIASKLDEPFFFNLYVDELISVFMVDPLSEHFEKTLEASGGPLQGLFNLGLQSNYADSRLGLYSTPLENLFSTSSFIERFEAISGLYFTENQNPTSYSSFTTDFMHIQKFRAELYEIYTFIQLGDKQYAYGDFIKALQWYQSAVSKASSNQYDEQRLVVLLRITKAWYWIFDAVHTIEHATATLVLAHHINNIYYKNLATLYIIEALAMVDLRGRWKEIAPLLSEGLRDATMLQNEALQLNYLVSIGECAVRLRQSEKAYDTLQNAINMLPLKYNQLDDWHFRIYRALSELSLQHNDDGAAIQYSTLAVALAQESHRPYFVASSQLALVHAERARGNKAEAMKLVKEIAREAIQMKWRSIEQQAGYLQAELEREDGDLEVAHINAQKALALAQELKLLEEEVLCQLNLGQISIALQKRDEAIAVLKQARRLSQEREYKDHFTKAEQLLQMLNDGGTLL